MASINICPAYAGMILQRVKIVIVRIHLSRVCGDDPSIPVSKVEWGGFVPRMRG